MHPSTFIKLVAWGLLSISFTQASSAKKLTNNDNNINRSVNRTDIDTEVVSESAGLFTSESEACESQGIDALIAADDSVSQLEPFAAAEIENSNSVVSSVETDHLIIFNRIFDLYKKAVPSYAQPGTIDWSHVNVINWPSYIDMSDINAWTEDHLKHLKSLLDADFLIIRPVSRVAKNSPKPLTVSKDEPAVSEADKVSAVSTSFHTKSRRNIRKAVSSPKPPSSSSSSESDIVVRTKPSSLKRRVISDTSESEESESVDEEPEESESEIVEEEPVKKIANKPVATSRSVSNKSKKPKAKVIQVKVDSDKPADPAKVEAILSKVLPIYRKQSGNSTATEIDWSLSVRFYLQKHVLPFSTSFETEGDVLTLERLMKNKYFGFHDRNKKLSRRIKAYERLYKLYLAVTRGLAHDFHIRWNQINVEGWPAGIRNNFNNWNWDDIKAIEDSLDSNAIKFTLKERLAKDLLDLEKSENISSAETESNESSSESSNESEVDVPPTSKSVPVRVPVKVSNVTVPKPKNDAVSSTVSRPIAPVARRAIKRSIVLNETETETETETEPEASLPPSTLKKSNKKAKIEPKKVSEVEAVVKVSEFEGATLVQSTEMIDRINVVIEIYSAEIKVHKIDSNSYAIISYMIVCLKLIQQHATAQSPDQIPDIGLNEILQFLESFHNCLAIISTGQVLDKNSLENFGRNRTKLNARLSRIVIQSKRQLNIAKSNV